MNSGQYQDEGRDDLDLSLGLRRELIKRGVTPDRFKTLSEDPNYQLLANEHFSNVKNEFFPEGLKKGGVFVTKRAKQSKGPKEGFPGPPTQYEEQSNTEDIPNQIENVQYETGEDGIQEVRKIEYVEPNGRRKYYDIKTNRTADNPRVNPIKPGQTLNEQSKQRGWIKNAYEGTVGPMDSTIESETLPFSSLWTQEENKFYQETGNVPPGRNLNQLNATGRHPWENQSTLINQASQGLHGLFGQINVPANFLRELKDVRNSPNVEVPEEMAQKGFAFNPNHVLLPGELPYATNPNTGMGYQKLPNQELFGRFENDRNDSGLTTAGKSVGNVLSAVGNFGVGLGDFLTGPLGYATAGSSAVAGGSINALEAASVEQIVAKKALESAAKNAATTTAEKTILTANLAKAAAAEGRAALLARGANFGEAALQGHFAKDLATGAYKSGEETYNALTTPTWVPGPDQFTDGGYVGTHADIPSAAYHGVETLGNAFFAKEIAKHTLTGSARNVIQPERAVAMQALGNELASLPQPRVITPGKPYVRPPGGTPSWGPPKEDPVPNPTEQYNFEDSQYDRLNNTVLDISNPAPFNNPGVQPKSQTLRDALRKQQSTEGKYQIYNGPLQEELRNLERNKPKEPTYNKDENKNIGPVSLNNSELLTPELIAQLKDEGRDPDNLIAGSTGRPSRPKAKDIAKDVKPGEEAGRPGEIAEPGKPVLRAGDTPDVVQPKPGLADVVASVVKPETKAPEVPHTKPEAPAAESPASKAAQARLNRELDRIEERRAFTQANLESGRITQELADTYFQRFDSAEKKAQDTFMEETKPSQTFLGVDVGNTGRTTVWNNQGRPRPQPPEKPKSYSATVEPPKPDAKPTIPGLPQMPMSALEAASDATKMGMTGETKSQFADRNIPNLNGRQAFEKNNGMLSRLTYDQLKDLHDTTVADPGHNPKFAAAVRDEMGSRERKVSDTYSTNQEGRNAISSNLKPELMTDADLKNVTDNHPALIQKQREIITGHNRGDFNSDLGKRSAEAEAAIRKLNELKYQLKFAREETNKRVRVKAGVARPDGTPIVASTERKLTAKRYDPITGEEVKGPVQKRNPVQALNHARGDLGLLSRDELVAARDALKAQGRDYYKKIDEAIKKRDIENERVHKRLYGSKAAEMPNPRTMDRAEIDRRLAELPGELKQAEESYAQTKSPEDAKHIHDIKTDLSGLRKEAENRDNLETQSLQYDRSKNPNYKQVSGDIQGRPTKSSVKPGVGPFKRDVSKPDATPIEGRDPNVIRAEGAAAYEAENQQAARTANQETIDRANAEDRQTRQTEQTAPAEAPAPEARQAEPVQTEPTQTEPVQTEAAKPDVTEEQAAKKETVASINDNADILDNMDSTKEISRILNGTRKEPGLVEQVRKTAEEWDNATSSADREAARNKMQDHIDELTSIRDDLQDRHDNTPESLQSTDAYDRREQMISDLDEAISGLEEQMYNMKGDSGKDLGDLTPNSNKSLSNEQRNELANNLQRLQEQAGRGRYDINSPYETRMEWIDNEMKDRLDGKTHEIDIPGDPEGNSTRVNYTADDIKKRFLNDGAERLLTQLEDHNYGDRYKVTFSNGMNKFGSKPQLVVTLERVSYKNGDQTIAEITSDMENPFEISSHGLHFRERIKTGNPVNSLANSVLAKELLTRIDLLNINVPNRIKDFISFKASDGDAFKNKRYNIQRKDGNRTYTEQQIKNEFIGRIATDRPELVRDYNISFEIKDDSYVIHDANVDQSRTISKTNYLLELSEKNPRVGYEGRIGSIYLEVDNSKPTEAYLSSSHLDDSVRGKRLGTVMYSEVAERLRSLGITKLNGYIIDGAKRPNQIRQRVIDAVNNELGNPASTSSQRGRVTSELMPNAYYSPGYETTRDINYGTTNRDTQIGIRNLDRLYGRLSPGMKEVVLSIEGGNKTVSDVLRQMAEQGVNKGDSGFFPDQGKIARLLLKNADKDSLSSLVRASDELEIGSGGGESSYNPQSPRSSYNPENINNLGGMIPGLKTGTVVFSRGHLVDHRTVAQTILHEITHAVTVDKVNRAIFGISNSFTTPGNQFGESGAKYLDRIKAYIKDPNSDKSIVKIARSYLKLLSTLDKEADSPISLSKANKATGNINKDNVIGNGPDNTREAARKGLYGATNLPEFIAEAMSNPDFQARLRSIKMGEKSVWENFKKSVAEMLGIAESDTALAHTMDGVMELSSKRLEDIKRPGVSYEDSLEKVREQRFQSQGDILPSGQARNERMNDTFNIRNLNTAWGGRIKTVRDIDSEIADLKASGNYDQAKVDNLEATKDILIDEAHTAMQNSPHYDTAVKNVGKDAGFDAIANEINHLNALDQRGEIYSPRNYKSDVESSMTPDSNKMPTRTSNEGNRTYTDTQMTSGFIGRVARDNPGFKKQFKIEFEVSDRETGPELTDKSEIDLEHEIEMENAYLDSQRQTVDTQTNNRTSTLEQENPSGDKYDEDLGFEDVNYTPTPGSRPPGTSVARLWITDKSGKNVGTIHVTIDEVKSGVAHLAESRIEAHMQGQGIGKLMYSELAERLRSMGITELTGWIADSKLRPNKIRQRIIDAVNKDLGYSDKTAMKKESISSTLRPEAYYSPGPESQTPVFNMTPTPSRMPAKNGRQFVAQEKQAAANAVQSTIEGFNSLKPKTMKDLKDTGVGIVTLGWLRGSSAQLDRLAEIHSIPEITEIRGLLMGNNAGEMSKARGEGFHTAVSSQNKVFQNKLNNILKPLENDLKLLSNKEQSAFLEEIGRAIVNPRPNSNPAIAEAAKQFRAVFKELHDYQTRAGIKLGDMGGTYMPRILRVDKVLENSEAFIEAATKAYRQSGLSEAEAKSAANDWFDNVLRNDEGFTSGGTSLTFDSGMHNGEPKHTRDRVFSADAERFMEPFYNRNVYDALTTYIGRAVKSAELTRRFGVDFSKYKDMQNRIIANGPNGAKILGEVNSLVASQIAPSQARTKLGRVAADANSLYQSLRFLTNATLSSMSEPIVNGMRTGNVMDAITGMGNSIQYAYRNARDLAPDYHEKLAQDIGVVQAHLATSAIATSVDTRYLDANSSRFTKTTINGFFRGTGLHQWTEGTRIASVKIGETFLNRLSSDIQEGGKPSQLSARLLNELGVTDHKAMADFIKRINEMPEEQRLRAIMNPRHKQAQEYRQALRKYSEQVIMNPNAGTRSKLAAHPLGAFIFGLQSYTYAFHENVLKRMGRVLVNEAILNKGDMSPANRMMLMGAFMSAPVFLAGQYMQGEIRDEAFTDPARAGDPPLTLGTKIARMISRAGGFGRLDAPVNLAASLKYNKSPETAFVGPTVSDASSTGAEILRLFKDDNSSKTNTQERKASRSVYNSVVQPGISAVASHLPGVTGRLASTGIHYTAKHPGVREAVVEEFAGPPVKARKDKKVNENWYDDRLRELGIDPTQQ